MRITCNKGHTKVVISAVDVLCTARYIEVFNDKDEYVMTEPGIRLDGLDTDNSPDHNTKADHIFLLQHSFNEPVAKCRIKVKD